MNEPPPLPQTVRRTLLERAAQLTEGERNVEYGDPVQGMNHIAELWCAYMAMRPAGATAPLDGYDVAMMLGLMKVARAARRPKGQDSLVDLAGYAGIAGEIRDRELRESTAPVVIQAPPPPRPPGL